MSDVHNDDGVERLERWVAKVVDATFKITEMLLVVVAIQVLAEQTSSLLLKVLGFGLMAGAVAVVSIHLSRWTLRVIGRFCGGRTLGWVSVLVAALISLAGSTLSIAVSTALGTAVASIVKYQVKH